MEEIVRTFLGIGLSYGHVMIMPIMTIVYLPKELIFVCLFHSCTSDFSAIKSHLSNFFLAIELQK